MLLIEPWHGNHAFPFTAVDIPLAELELDHCSFLGGVTWGRDQDDNSGSGKSHDAILSYFHRSILGLNSEHSSVKLVNSSSASARVCGVRVLGAWASVRYRHTPAKPIPEENTTDELYAVLAVSDSPSRHLWSAHL